MSKKEPELTPKRLLLYNRVSRRNRSPRNGIMEDSGNGGMSGVLLMFLPESRVIETFDDVRGVSKISFFLSQSRKTFQFKKKKYVSGKKETRKKKLPFSVETNVHFRNSGQSVEVEGS